ncbi:MAG: hypothetical protein ACO3F2_10850 [Roseiflexaceae bacterium]
MRQGFISILIMSVISLTACTPSTAEPIVITVVVPYGADNTQTSTPEAPATRVMGSTKAQVDALLNDWTVRADRTSTNETAIYRYTQDVTLIVAFREDLVIGVYVIDNPGTGVIGITPTRADELVELIGGIIDVDSVVADENGFREFGIGDITSW